MLISQYFGIHEDTPFRDVNVLGDNRLFIDAFRIRVDAKKSGEALAATRCIDSWLDELLNAVGARSDLRGHELLGCFHELWETRFGLSRVGYRGKGGSRVVGEHIWSEMTTNLDALIEVGLFRRLEHLPVFVPGIHYDITSDITTRTIYSVLAEFTTKMILKFPQFTDGHHRLGTFSRQVWDSSSSDWVVREFVLPMADGQPLLLVPKEWVSTRLELNSDRFNQHAVLSYAQDKTEVWMPGEGKFKRSYKKDLKQLREYSPGRANNIRASLEAYGIGRDLVSDFELVIRRRFDS